MKLSSFGKKLTSDSGILQLMDDLGRPLPAGVTPYMLGGGNPARITEVESAYRREMEKLLSDRDAFEDAISKYDAPQGRISFIDALVHFFRTEYGWDIHRENIAITNGSQTAFFIFLIFFPENIPSAEPYSFRLYPNI
ncbi:hypothetical protein K7I13_00920 [Brucepastera parasyntrophica]|uniref:hypothetical protein n=1 Tax=Brucepastera parasyntrophica TaxID=2880008 RepID=UPI00210AF9A9|nr:hypothetical protein [Brucepastera parasyntrophica]ULQ59941.1 hypothetical protein K7I13_00920 [Brucepastera parasyntrophica]